MMAQRLSGLALLVYLASPVSTAAAQDAYAWQDLAGTWRGEGMLRAAPEGALEQGVCRFDIDATAEQSLSIAGRCATAAQTGQVSTQLSRDGSGAITGSATSPLVSEPVALTGSQDGATIALASTEPVEMEGQSYAVSSQLRGWSSDGVFTLVQQLAKPNEDPVVVMHMRFSRTP
jgi:hypothetical protein